MATVIAEAAKAMKIELAKTKIRDKKRNARLPSDLINLGANRKKIKLPIAPKSNNKLTVFGSKNSLKKEE